jgi:hypothetical protein
MSLDADDRRRRLAGRRLRQDLLLALGKTDEVLRVIEPPQSDGWLEQLQSSYNAAYADLRLKSAVLQSNEVKGYLRRLFVDETECGWLALSSSKYAGLMRLTVDMFSDLAIRILGFDGNTIIYLVAAAGRAALLDYEEVGDGPIITIESWDVGDDFAF